MCYKQLFHSKAWRRIPWIFQGKEGFAPGDPLAPYLFVLLMEYFNILMRCLSKTDNFKFHPKCSNHGLTNHCFANEMFIFAHGDLRTPQDVKKVLDEFCQVSRMSINNKKSKVFCDGMEPSLMHQVKAIFGMESGTLLVTDLGVSFCSRRAASEDYKPLIHKISSKVNS